MMYTDTQKQPTNLPCTNRSTADKQDQADRLSIQSTTSIELNSGEGFSGINPLLLGLLALVSIPVILTPLIMLLFLFGQSDRCQATPCPSANPPAILIEKESKQERFRLELPTSEQ